MIEHKGYKVVQVPNHHVVITKDSKWVLHTQCDKPKSDDELREIVDFYIELTQSGKFDEIYDDVEDEEVDI